MRPWQERIVADHRKPEEWLAYREGDGGRLGASDVASFAKEESVDSYVAAKLAPSWSGSEYSEWGNAREPVILLDHGFEQNHFMLEAEDNPRFVATPDAISGNTLVQVKTSIKSFISKRTNLPLIPPTYKRQMWWEQFVAGPEFMVTKFIYEKYDRVGDEFLPEFESTVIDFHRDEEEIAKLVRIANKVLHALNLSQF